MPVGGVGHDPDHTRHLAQDNRVWSARARELEAGLDECSPDGAAWTRSAARRRITRATTGLRVSSYHCPKV